MGVSDKTRAPRGPDQAKRWLAFLRNHREAIAAMDFFTVPTITFGVLYCFFIISHDRRCIPHVNVTKHPTSVWIIQQLRETFPFEASHKYLIFDRDQKFGFEVIAAIKATYVRRTRTRVPASERLRAVSKRRWYSGLLYQERSYLVSADVLANYTRSRGVGLQVHGNRVESVDVASHVVDIRVVRYGIWAAVGQGKKSIAGGVSKRGAEAAQRVCWRPVLEGVSKPGKIGEGTGAGLVESTNGASSFIWA